MKDVDPNSISIVVLDTNILLRDPLIRGAHLQTLFPACRKFGIQVVVPDVVRDELEGHRINEIAKSWQIIEGERKQLRRFMLHPPAAKPDTSSEWDEYREHLDIEFERYGIANAPYPAVSAQELVRTSYTNKKPFKVTGEGYKDFLVFRSIVPLLKPNTTCIFVTENFKDFCDSQNSLHPDLLALLPADSEVVVCKSAWSLYEELIAPLHAAYAAMENAEEIAKAIREGKFPGFNLEDILANLLLGALLDTSGVDLSDIDTPLDEPSVLGLLEYEADNEVDVSAIDDESISIGVSGSVGIELWGFLEKFEYFGEMDELKKVGVTLDDGNWNDHVVSVHQVKTARFSLTAVYSRKEQIVTSTDVSLFEDDVN